MKAWVKSLGAGLAAFTMSACAHMSDVPGLGAEQGAGETGARERVRAAIELLGQGEERRARAEIRAVLAANPSQPTARRLLQQIEEDPRQLLGANARAYTVRAGETMSVLAERFLGDGLLFYALARYNHIEAPNALSAGQSLMIPVRPGIAAQPRAASASEAALEAPVLPAQPRQPSANSVRANQLRLQGLQRLNAGQVDGAIALLQQARALDAANPAIERDLQRAMRLRASLRAGRG